MNGRTDSWNYNDRQYRCGQTITPSPDHFHIFVPREEGISLGGQYLSFYNAHHNTVLPLQSQNMPGWCAVVWAALFSALEYKTDKWEFLAANFSVLQRH